MPYLPRLLHFLSLPSLLYLPSFCLYAWLVFYTQLQLFQCTWLWMAIATQLYCSIFYACPLYISLPCLPFHHAYLVWLSSGLVCFVQPPIVSSLPTQSYLLVIVKSYRQLAKLLSLSSYLQICYYGCLQPLLQSSLYLCLPDLITASVLPMSVCIA